MHPLARLLACRPAVRPPAHNSWLCLSPNRRYSRARAAGTRRGSRRGNGDKEATRSSRTPGGCSCRCRCGRRFSKGPRRSVIVICRKPGNLRHVDVPFIGVADGRQCQLCRRAAKPLRGRPMKGEAAESPEPGSSSGSEGEPDQVPCPFEESAKAMDVERPSVCVKVRIEGSVFSVERHLLASGSEYFRALFQSGMRESQQEEIQLQGLSARGFLVILSVLQGERPLLTADEIVEVIEGAAFLQVQTMVKHLANILNTDNCLLIYHTAWVYGLMELVQTTALFIRDAYEDLKEDLGCLPSDVVNLVESLIPNSYVMVGTHSPSTELLRDACRTVCYLDEEENDWRILTSLPLDASTTNAAVTVLDNKLYIVGGVADVCKNIVDSGFCYDPEADAWSVFPSPTQPRYNASFIGHEGALYLIGGEFQRKAMASVEVFKPANNTWSPTAHLPRTATNVPCTKAMNRIFICLWRPKDATEIYEYVTEGAKWELVTTLVRAQSYGHYMVSHRDNLYVMRNGPDDDFLRCMMDCYNLTTGQWTAIPGQYEALFTAAIRGDSVFTLNRRVTEEYIIRDLCWKSRKLREGFPRIGTMWTFLLRLPRRKREPLERPVPTSRQELRRRRSVLAPETQSSCVE